MYSMPQQAVTNGYWKMENFRAQPMASSSLVVRNPASDISLPIESAVVPGVVEADHQDPEEDRHPGEAPRAELPEDDGPRVEKHELHVEENEKDRGQVELDGQMARRDSERRHPGLEGLRLHFRRLLRTEDRREEH